MYFDDCFLLSTIISTDVPYHIRSQKNTSKFFLVRLEFLFKCYIVWELFYHGFLRQCFKLAFYHKNWIRYFTQIYHRLTRKRQRATQTLPQESRVYLWRTVERRNWLYLTSTQTLRYISFIFALTHLVSEPKQSLSCIRLPSDHLKTFLFFRRLSITT